MTEKRNLLDRALGLEEKRVWKAIENRAKALPEVYQADYTQMKKYIFAAGVGKWEDYRFAFEQLLDLLEELAADGRKVTEVTGSDVASFLDELVESKTWTDQQGEKLNKKWRKEAGK